MRKNQRNLNQVPNNYDEMGRNTASEYSDSGVSEISILLDDTEEHEDFIFSSELNHSDSVSVH